MTIVTRQIHVPGSMALNAFIEQRVKATLRRHIDRVGRVVVRLMDVNGPRKNAADKVCRMNVELDAQPLVVAVGESSDIYDAVRDAAARLGHAVDKRLGHLPSQHHRRARRRNVHA